MTKKQLQPFVDGVVTYILSNEPQTLDTLQARARDKPWYTESVFYDIVSLLGSDTRLSVKTESDGSGITFRKRRAVIRTKPTMAQEMQERARVLRAMYPVPSLDTLAWHPALDECYCHMFHTREATDWEHHTYCVKTGETWERRTELFMQNI